MKKIILSSVAALLLASASSASAMDAMMKHDSSMMMKSDAMMMKSDTMMKPSVGKMESRMMSMTTAGLAAKLGYTWKSDRMKLASLAGIKNYRGSASQNIAIKKYLTSLQMSGVMVGGQSMIRSRDIVENAVRANNVTTVVAAVSAAGLVETLKSEGPFTVFAPNNNAFAKLPTGTVETLLKKENKDQLTSILTYHVVAGKYTTSDLTDGLMLTTVQGQKLTFTRDASGMLMINGSAMLETADVLSTN